MTLAERPQSLMQEFDVLNRPDLAVYLELGRGIIKSHSLYQFFSAQFGAFDAHGRWSNDDAVGQDLLEG
jgi:hypothetical protein